MCGARSSGRFCIAGNGECVFWGGRCRLPETESLRQAGACSEGFVCCVVMSSFLVKGGLGLSTKLANGYSRCKPILSPNVEGSLRQLFPGPVYQFCFVSTSETVAHNDIQFMSLPY